MSTREDRTNVLLIILGALFCSLSFVLLLFGKHHVDEGYYHLIAHLTAEGKLPYRDYLFVQTPLFPIVYGWIFRISGSSFLMARGISVLFSLLNFILAIRIAGKYQGKSAAGIAALFIICQPFTIYYLTIIKLYALSGLLLTVLVTTLTLRINPIVKYPLASALAALSIATRLTLLPALPVVLFIAFLRTRDRARWITCMLATASGVLVLAATLLPFYMLSPDTFGYSVLGYHLDKEGFSLARQILHKIDVLSRLSKLYFPLILALALIIAAKARNWRFFFRSITSQDTDGYDDGYWVIGSIVLFHFTSQEPYVHRYLAMLIPTVAALAAPELIKLKNQLLPRKTNGLSISWCLMGALTLFGMGQWEIDVDKPNPVAQLKSIANEIAFITGKNDMILTFNNSIAVESNRSVMVGDEMNVLTYHPDWDREKCEKFHVLNVDMLVEALVNNQLRAVLITQYSFIGNFPTFYNPGEKGARPRVMAALEKHYHRINTFTGFGYLGEPADLYLPLNKNRSTAIDDFGSEAPVQIYRNEETID